MSLYEGAIRPTTARCTRQNVPIALLVGCLDERLLFLLLPLSSIESLPLHEEKEKDTESVATFSSSSYIVFLLRNLAVVFAFCGWLCVVFFFHRTSPPPIAVLEILR
jgi:hypothetical protein